MKCSENEQVRADFRTAFSDRATGKVLDEREVTMQSLFMTAVERQNIISISKTSDMSERTAFI